MVECKNFLGRCPYDSWAKTCEYRCQHPLQHPDVDAGAMPGSSETVHITAPEYNDRSQWGPYDITSQIEKKVGPIEDHVSKGAPINGHNCVVGACPFLGEHCGTHGGSFGSFDTFDELYTCVWGAAARGDADAMKIVIDYAAEGEMTPQQIEAQRQSWARSCVTDQKPLLPTGSQERKDTPIYSGVIAYFPRALAAVAGLSKKGNDKHNPGQHLHWSKGKSSDHLDCVARHLVENGTVDPDDGELHDVKMAWRALANLEMFLEARAEGITKEELVRRYQEEEKK